MAFSMFDLSVPELLRHLHILSGYLDRARWYAEKNGIEESVLVQARLAPDMMSLAGQEQRATDNAKAGIGRLASVQAPFFPDTENTLDELMVRIGISLSETIMGKLDGKTALITGASSGIGLATTQLLVNEGNG